MNLLTINLTGQPEHVERAARSLRDLFDVLSERTEATPDGRRHKEIIVTTARGGAGLKLTVTIMENAQ